MCKYGKLCQQFAIKALTFFSDFIAPLSTYSAKFLVANCNFFQLLYVDSRCDKIFEVNKRDKYIFNSSIQIKISFQKFLPPFICFVVPSN